MLPRPKNGGIDFRNKQKVNTFISWWFEVNLNKEMVVVFLFANNWLRRSFHHAFWKDRLAFVSKLNSKSRKKKKRKKIQYPSWKSFSTEYNKFKFLIDSERGWEPRLFPYFFMEKVDFKTDWRQIWTLDR